MFPMKSRYSVKEIFYTIQGEGIHAGRAAVFCRFTGCNGWSGMNKDRGKGPFPCSSWCDTDFVGGRRMDEDELVASILELFPTDRYRMLVFTGGEPALQLTSTLLRTLKPEIPTIAIETNGSLALPEEARDCWITCSPKTPRVVQDRVSELKLIYPTIPPEQFDYIRAAWRFLQPLHDRNLAANTASVVEYIKAHPEWQLSLQTHKYIGIP